MLSLQQAAVALAATASGGDPVLLGVGTDTRTELAGRLYVALRGERFDGHDYVREALAAGASAAMVEQGWAHNQADAADLPLLIVADTRLALGSLGRFWRARFTLPLIGVTGSNGKTTVKEMCAAILRAQAALDGVALPDTAVLATEGNLNNDLGVPQMLLRLRPEHRAAVIEMGMNRPGEIAYLAGLAQPTVAIVTNAQRAHLAGMGALAAVAQEKGAVYASLGAAGVAVINADDAHADYWCGLNSGRRIVRFGLAAHAEVRADYRLSGLGAALQLQTPQGETDFSLQVPGLHNVRNALGAAAATLAAGVGLEAVRQGLAGFTGAKGRLQASRGPLGCTVIDDTYNANPDSVCAAIDVLAATPGRKILVLGDMGEIGDMSAQYHDEVGGYAKSQGVDSLYALGEFSAVAARNFGDGGRHFERIEELQRALARELDADTAVLVKGSRFMRMERVVEALLGAESQQGKN